MIFTAKQRSFYLNKQPFFLYSGEIHYFRLKRELWATHLRKLKAAGATMVSTYIPWSWHEYAEGALISQGKPTPDGIWLALSKPPSPKDYSCRSNRAPTS